MFFAWNTGLLLPHPKRLADLLIVLFFCQSHYRLSHSRMGAQPQSATVSTVLPPQFTQRIRAHRGFVVQHVQGRTPLHFVQTMRHRS